MPSSRFANAELFVVTKKQRAQCRFFDDMTAAASISETLLPAEAIVISLTVSQPLTLVAGH